MAFKLIIKPIVFIDIEESLIFYKDISNKLSERFYNNFLQSVKDIQLSPHNCSYIKIPVRRHCIKEFPYKNLLYYF